MTNLPRNFYDERARLSAGWGMRVWLFALLAFVSGWSLFDLPGSPIHLLRLPEDMPSFGVGLEDTYITEDGTWIIKRKHYADRMSRYEIDAQGKLSKFRGALREVNPEMEGRVPRPETIRMQGGTMPKVKPSRGYYLERAKYRKDRAKVPVHEASAVTPEQTAIEAAITKLQWEEPYVLVLNYRPGEVTAAPVLQGHTHYEVLDSWTFYRPHIWVTTDRLKHLHKLHATDAGGIPKIMVEKTVDLNLDYVPEFDSKLGIDPHRNLLYLLTYRGERLWFDPETLELQGREQLPGMWQREYAAIGFMAEQAQYPQYAIGFGRVGGFPLTEDGYLRLMRVLAVTFLASLILLALELMKAWRSTSGQTTAATS